MTGDQIRHVFYQNKACRRLDGCIVALVAATARQQRGFGYRLYGVRREAF